MPILGDIGFAHNSANFLTMPIKILTQSQVTIVLIILGQFLFSGPQMCIADYLLNNKGAGV